jgi:hypothetical protein
MALVRAVPRPRARRTAAAQNKIPGHADTGWKVIDDFHQPIDAIVLTSKPPGLDQAHIMSA